MSKLPSLKIEVKPPYALPNWYGVAYYDFNRMVAITMPFPIFIIIGLFKRVHLRIMSINLDTRETKIYENAFKRGQEIGENHALLKVERGLLDNNFQIDRKTLKITKIHEKDSRDLMEELEGDTLF